MSVCGLITARSGSKGIPGKNLANCGGRPLLEWTCIAAVGSTRLDRVLISTDGPEIAAVARACGVEAPFLRPVELATDGAGSLEVIAHALDWLESHSEPVTALVLLQPTSPLRTAAHIDAAVTLFLDSGADTVVSVMDVPHRFHPESLMVETRGHLAPFAIDRIVPRPRQELLKVVARNGPAVLVTKPSVIRSERLYGDDTRPYHMSAKDSVDVDDSHDLRYAEWLLRETAPERTA